jgi:type II secretory pathway pseudopilin PulG
MLAMRRLRAGVLLEVLLALILFTAAAAVVTTAFNASVASLERQKLGSQALNLAASIVAEVQLGIRPANSDGSRPLEPPFEDWTWETALSPLETVGGGLTDLTRVEVIVRHQKSSTVQRLAQVVRLTQSISTNSTGAFPQL